MGLTIIYKIREQILCVLVHPTIDYIPKSKKKMIISILNKISTQIFNLKQYKTFCKMFQTQIKLQIYFKWYSNSIKNNKIINWIKTVHYKMYIRNSITKIKSKAKIKAIIRLNKTGHLNKMINYKHFKIAFKWRIEVRRTNNKFQAANCLIPRV